MEKPFSEAVLKKNVQNPFSSKSTAKLQYQGSANMTSLPTLSQEMLEIVFLLISFSPSELEWQNQSSKNLFQAFPEEE